MNKTTKRSNSTKKKSTTKVKRSLPKFISKNTADTYRVRKTSNGVTFDKTVATLKEAKAIVKTMS